MADSQAMFGRLLIDACQADPDTGRRLPVVTIVTDNGGPFWSLNGELFITRYPELKHVRTRGKTPRPNAHANAGSGR